MGMSRTFTLELILTNDGESAAAGMSPPMGERQAHLASSVTMGSGLIYEETMDRHHTSLLIAHA